ncbi:hypothetical protein N8Y93_02755 [Litorivicinus sp.]|jgi:hypothetical protein|nr:hypothetical protein [Litorivicinus sp.]
MMHWVLIVFLKLDDGVISSTKIDTVPLDYGAVFSSESDCQVWGEARLVSKSVDRFICLPRPAYKSR